LRNRARTGKLLFVSWSSGQQAAIRAALDAMTDAE
jgi:hypothetical protein